MHVQGKSSMLQRYYSNDINSKKTKFDIQNPGNFFNQNTNFSNFQVLLKKNSKVLVFLGGRFTRVVDLISFLLLSLD